MNQLIKTDILANSFVILFHFVNFLLGLIGLFIIYRRVNFVSPEIQRSFFRQAMFYNLSLIFSAVTDFLDYFFREIVSSDLITVSFLYSINILSLGMYLLWSFAFAEMVNSFLGNPDKLRNRKWFRYLFVLAFGYLIILFLNTIFRFIPSMYFISSLAIINLSLLLNLIFSVYLNRKARLEDKTARSHALRILARLFIVFSLTGIFVFLNFYPLRVLPQVITKFSYNIMDLLYNSFMLFWALKFLDSLNTSEEPIAVEKESIESTVMKYQISKRELEVIHLVCAGKSNQEIADLLFISLGTVKNHLYNIYSKIGIRNRTQLSKIFLEETIPKS